MRFHADRNEVALTVEGVLSTFYFVLTQTVIFTSLALHFNLDEVWLGLASSFPMAFQVFQILAPAIIERFPRKKSLLIFLNSGRFLWLLLIPYILHTQRTPRVFLLVHALSQVFASLAGNVWITIVSDTISQERRGKYLGLRNLFVSLTMLSGFYLYSLILDGLAKPYNYVLVVAITMLTSFLSLLALAPLEERSARRTGSLNDLRTVLSDRNFMKLSKAYFFWNFVVLMAAPFFGYHQLQNLRLPVVYISYATVVASVLSMIFYGVWGRLSDEFGHKSVLIAGISIVSVTPAVWIFMNERDWVFALALDAILSGVGWAAVNLAFVTLPMETARTTSPVYFAVFSALGGLGGTLGSLVGGPVARIFNGFDFWIGEFHVFGLQVFFLVQSLLRFAVLPMFTKVESKKYVSPQTLLSNVVSLLSGRHALRIQEGNRAEVVVGRRRLARWW